MRITFIPVKMRLPLKFGAETIESIQIAHVKAEVYGAEGLGETPLSVAWAWPSELSFAFREESMCRFCCFISEYIRKPENDPMTWGKYYLDGALQTLLDEFNRTNRTDMPYLAALICFSAFDIAVHDAWGKAHGLPVYKMYNRQFMEHDLAWFFGDERFAGKYPQDYFVSPAPQKLPVWHLVGGKDLLFESETHQKFTIQAGAEGVDVSAGATAKTSMEAVASAVSMAAYYAHNSGVLTGGAN